MQLNYGIQNASALAWDGTAATPVDVRGYNGFSFSLTATADLAADTIFKVQAAPASGADPCLPGTFADVPEVLTCVASWGSVPGPTQEILLPAGTKKGARCTVGVPCPVGPFVQLAAVSGGTATVVGTVGLHGPQR